MIRQLGTDTMDGVKKHRAGSADKHYGSGLRDRHKGLAACKTM